MRRPRPWAKNALVALFGIIWCGMLLYLCVWCPMVFTGNPEALGFVKVCGKLWIVMSGVAFAHLLFISTSSVRSFRMRGGRVRVGDLHNFLNDRKAMFKGLVGGLLCSLPALAITMVGLIVSVPHPDGWITSDLSVIASNKLMEGVTIEPAPESKKVYLIGIDLSRSSLSNSHDPRLKQICKAVNMILVREQGGAFPELVKSEDSVSFYIFAKTQKPLYISGTALEKPSNSQISEKICKDLQILSDQLIGPSDDIERGKTDIVDFMEDMAGKMKALPENPQGTIVIFSDFRQNNELRSLQVLDERISSLMSDIDTHGQQLVGFSMSTLDDGVDGQGIDIRSMLKQHGWSKGGERRIFKEIQLEASQRTDTESRSEILRNFYPEVRLPGGLHLKYQVFPIWTGARTSIDLPNLPAYGKVLLALRPPEGGDGRMSDISLDFGDSMLRPIVVKMGETVPYEASGSRQGRLPIKLFNSVDISRTVEFDLLVISPGRSVTHTVRLVVLPTVGSLPFEMLRWALALAAVTFILLVVGASGADLWFRRRISWLYRKLGLRRKSRRPSVLAKVKGGPL